MRIFCFVFCALIARVAFSQATFHGNYQRTGVYDSPPLTQLHGVKWQFKTDGLILGSPAIANGIVYFGSADTFLYAVDQETGKEKWKFETSGPISSTPTIDGGGVYFISYDGNFHSLDAITGKLVWKFEGLNERRIEAPHLHGQEPKTQTIPDPWDFFQSSAAVANGKVVFGCGDGNVYALDASTGKLAWKFSTRGVVHSSPAIWNGTIIIGSWDSNLYALDIETGKEKWRFHAGEDDVRHNQVGFTSSPAVVDGVIYVGCRDAHVYAIDANSGRKIWTRDTAHGWVSATPAVRDGVVYIGTGSSLQFLALDAKTGKDKYTFKTNGVFSSAALAGDFFYLGNANGKLEAFACATGKLAWEFQTDASKQDVEKILNPDGTFNPQTLGRMIFFDFEDGYILMSRRFSVGTIYSSPVVDKGEVYFGSTDGNLYALH